MIEGKSAAFRFTKFQIPTFSYNASEKEDNEIAIGFTPNGSYNESEGIFTLTIKFKGIEKTTNKEVINVTCKALFKFETGTSIKNIPTYFYKNAIAITFPYLRSFISTLTLQANCKLLVLRIMNLSNLEKPLRDSVIIEKKAVAKKVAIKKAKK